MKELREAKGFTHKDLAARINFILKKGIEDALREQGNDMRSAWWLRDSASGKAIGPTLLVDAGGVGDAVADDLAKDLGVPFVRYR